MIKVKHSKHIKKNTKKHTKTNTKNSGKYGKHGKCGKRNTKNTKNNKKNNMKKQMQRGGGMDCSLATVKEPGFNIPALGDIAGLNINDSRGVISRPDCKIDSNHAMTP